LIVRVVGARHFLPITAIPLLFNIEKTSLARRKRV